MHKKDYEILADEISRSLMYGIARALFVDSLCHRLKVQNPRFNADQFRAACSPASRIIMDLHSLG
jgi:hypothetical protein